MKKFVGWFRPVQRGIRRKSFILTPITLQRDESLGSFKNLDRKRIVISVPKSCGNAVKRNRVRRILRPYLEAQLTKLPERKGLWIRISKRCCLSKTETLTRWKNEIDQALLKVGS